MATRKKNYSNVERELWILSGNECAHEGCTSRMVTESGAYVGQIAHIRGVGSTSARHDPRMSDDELRDKNNLVLLCYAHHVESDDESRYTVKRMREMKERHESRFRKAYAEFEAQFIDYTDSVYSTHCQRLTRWLEVLGLDGEDFDDEYVQTEMERLNALADRLSSLTEQARRAVAFVVRYGAFSLMDNTYHFPLAEMARRTKIGRTRILETFAELERLNFGHVSLDSGFDNEPPEVIVFAPGESPHSHSEYLSMLHAYCEQSDCDLDGFIVHLRFDLLDL